MRQLPVVLLVCAFAAAFGADERINHEGRLLGPLLSVPDGATPILFNTQEADAIVDSLQIMPRDSAWNEDISGRPVAANSAAMLANISEDLRTQLQGQNRTERQRLVVFKEMNYVLVPNDQQLVDVRIRKPGDLPEEGYPDESDDRKPGTDDIATVPYPSNLPVETWPSDSPVADLTEWQKHTGEGDRHTITVMPGTGDLWESWIGRLTNENPPWVVSVVARFNLGSNALRPLGWTSADAAGLPMFPALVRYSEVQRGRIEHAMRIVVKRSRRSYIYPASHHAGSTNDANYPAMGQRIRLKASYPIPDSWSAQEKAVGAALKKYGAFVADNGGFFSISICPDHRWPAGCWSHFSTTPGSDRLVIGDNFEVIETTGATGGPRAGTAPTCNAGADQGVTLAAGATLGGSTTAPVPAAALTTLWEVWDKPAGSTVTFANAGQLATTATFSAVGAYTLRLRASDGVHVPAYDAVMITVSAGSNPAPTLGSLSPATRAQNGGAFTLTVNGTGFVPASQVTWSGRANLAAATVNGTGTQLTATVPAGYLSTAGTPQIAVSNPAPGGGVSAGLTLTIAADLAAPVISAVAAGSLTSSGATITWTTNEPASSAVDHGLTAAYGTTSSSGTLVTSHSRTLTGLAAGTTYHFRVRSSDGAGNAAASGDATFTTAAAPGGGGGGGAGGEGGGGGCGLGGGIAVLLLALGALRLRR